MYVIYRKSDGKVARFTMVTTSDGFIDVYIGFRFGECVAVFDTEDNANLVINTTQPMIATLDLPGKATIVRQCCRIMWRSSRSSLTSHEIQVILLHQLRRASHVHDPPQVRQDDRNVRHQLE